MRFKPAGRLFAAALLATIAHPASANDMGQIAGAVATAAEGFGQGVGDAAAAGPSVYVTATGHARLPAPLTEAYLVNIEGKSRSAVEAAALRDHRLETARAIAKTFAIEVEVGKSSFSRQVDSDEQNRREAKMNAQRLAHPGAVVMDDAGPLPMIFAAVTGVSFRSPDPHRLPPFLDALQAAGVDSDNGSMGAPAFNMFAGAGQVLGFGRVEKVDDALWDQASQDAIAIARRQAAVLAHAAGRDVGEARQILFLARSAEGDEASVTVAIRYGLAPPAH